MGSVIYIGGIRPGVIAHTSTGEVYCPYNQAVTVPDIDLAGLLAGPFIAGDGASQVYVPPTPHTYKLPLLRDDGVFVDSALSPLVVGSSSVQTLSQVAASGIAGGRALVADQLGFQSNLGSIPSARTSRKKHTIRADCAGLRFGYGAGSTTVEVATYPYGLFVSSYLETADGALWPMTFGGQPRAYVEWPGFVISDPVGLDFLDGDIIWSKTFATTPFGGSKTTIEGHIAGDTTFTAATLPNKDFLGRIDTLGPQPLLYGAEVVQVSDVQPRSGAGPFTYTHSAATAVHALGTVVAQQMLCNTNVRRFNTGEGYASTDVRASVGTAGLTVPAADATTLSASVGIGDTFIDIAAAKLGDVYTVDGEALGIRSVQQGSPYRAYLTSPATATHTSGAAVTTNDGIQNVVAPSFIVADRVKSTRRKSVAIIGTSIPNGGGYITQPTPWSWVNHAFPDRPHVNASKAGDQIALYVLAANSRLRRNASDLCDVLVNEYSTNDFFGAARSFAQVAADCVTEWRRGRTRGLFTIHTTCTPKTVTSSDRWATVAGQTDPGLVGATYLNKYQLNVWLRDGAPLNTADFSLPSGMFSGTTYTAPTSGVMRARLTLIGTTLTTRAEQSHPLTLVTDDASVFEVSATNSVWIANPVAADGPLTYDGLHPTTSGHRLRGAYWVTNVVPLLTQAA